MTKVKIMNKAIPIHNCETCGGNVTIGCQKHDDMPFYTCPDNKQWG